MSFAVNLLSTMLLLFWPLLLMMSPMAFDAPGSENQRSHVFVVLLVLSYPIGLAALYWVLGGSFWGLSGRTFTLLATIIVVGALTVFGYGTLLKNSVRGIASSGYDVVNERVYYNARWLPEANAKQFELLDSSYGRGGYARDDQSVFYRGERLADVDAASFATLDDGEEYWQDKQRVYLDGVALEGVDSGAFTRIKDAWGHATDYALAQQGEQSVLFYRQHHITEVVADDVVVLWPHIAKDKQRIYYLQHIILPMADAASFDMLPNSNEYGKDQYAVYDVLYDQSGVIAGADPNTITLLGRGYLKDEERVYYRSGYEPTQVLANADVDSFVVTDWDDATQSEARDRSSLFMRGQVIAPAP